MSDNDLRPLDPPSVSAVPARGAALVAAAFAVISVLAAADIVTDVTEGTTVRHVALEAGVVVVGLVGLGLGLRRVMALRRTEVALRRENRALGSMLEATRAEAARWRSESRELLDGLAVAIERQFGRWQFTPAEHEVAALLLKGFSHKEIASIRGVGEATVRQQARGLYKKAGVDGRHGLAAFFLEELLPGDRESPATERRP